MMAEPLPGQAWDDACESYGPGAAWRLRVLREALRCACVDVVRLSAEGGPAPLEPHELAATYVETAEARLVLEDLELDAHGSAEGAAAEG